MLKKIFISVLFIFTLYSCSGNTQKDTESNGLILNEQTDFSLFVPSNWITMSGSSLTTLTKPSVGEISFVSSSNDDSLGFSNNLVIIKQNLSSDISSYDFSKLNNPSIKKDFSYFKTIKTKDISFSNDKSMSSQLYIYEAKYSTQTPTLNFLQTSVVCGRNGYLITIRLSKDNTSFTKYENILKTFSCK